MIITQINVADFGIDIQELNPVINSFIKSNLSKRVREFNMDSERAASITPFNLHTFNNEAVTKILELVLSITPRVAITFALDAMIDDDKYDKILNHTLNTGRWNPEGFHLEECWGIVYNGRQGVSPHNHFPSSISFSYYSKADENSAPLNVDGEEIPAKEGYLTMFSAHSTHWVNAEDNESEERIALVGNLDYHGFIS